MKDSIDLVCAAAKHRPLLLGVLFPPRRAPLTGAEFDAKVDSMMSLLLWSSLGWSEERARAEAESAARKDELSATELTYQSHRVRRTRGGRWTSVDRSALSVVQGPHGRIFIARCNLCHHVVRWPEAEALQRTLRAIARGDSHVDIAG